MRYLITLLLFLAPSAYGTDYSFKYGLGILSPGPTTEIKVLTVRAESPLFYAFREGWEVGGWSDVGEGRKHSALAAYQIGVRPESESVYFKAFWGVVGLTATDSQLGGVGQFMSDFGFGFHDSTSFVGVGMKHISSAGIFMPNRGRDFIQMELGVSY